MFINIYFFIKLFYFGDWGLGIGDWGLGPIPNPQSPIHFWGLGIGDWGLGIGDWGLGPIPNPQSPIPIIIFYIYKFCLLFLSFIYNLNL